MVYRRTEKVASRLVTRRQGILAAAERRVATEGWRAVTVAGVAEGAGIAVGTVYRHVADKDALCAEVFERAATRELAAVRDAAREEQDPLAALEAGLATFAWRALRRPRLAYALLAEPATATVEERRLAFRQDYRRLFEQLLAEAIDVGDLGPCHVATTAAVLVGALGEGLVGPLAPARTDVDDPDPRVVDELLACCLRALPKS